MVNEFAYCPRLAYLEWVQGEWADNVETLEGAHVHRRVDEPQGPRVAFHTRSVALSSETLGVTAVIDFIEREGRRVRPIDYKRGARPAVADGAYEPERVQLCVQGLLLREHGYECHEGLLYFAASKQRVRVRFTPQLVERTLELIARLRETFAAGAIPPPLEDSPKCPRCSLVSICLPEEVRFLLRGGSVRPIGVTDPQTHPLVVQEPGSSVRLQAGRLMVHREGQVVGSARLAETSQVVLMGSVSCSTPAVHACCEHGIGIAYMSGTGWLHGLTSGMAHKNVELRAAQFADAADGERSLQLARALVAAKVRNGRVLLRRNGRAPAGDLEVLATYARMAEQAKDAESLLGIEGSAARLYYSHLTTMLKGTSERLSAFDFAARNRRPPKDPLNALLSFAYSLLLKDWVFALSAVGFDPLMGFYHRPRYGKPALALDLMEPYRHLIGDSVAIGAVNNGEIGAGDFTTTLGGVLLTPTGRRKLILAYERRMAQTLRHPLFRYRCRYRRLFELDARLLGRFLLREIHAFPAYVTR
jgi:CRISPR-associated endonuclease Cas1/CRISPR-associated protein Cas4